MQTILRRTMHVKAIKMRWATGGVNYSYLLSTQDFSKSWLIDPAEAYEVEHALTTKDLQNVCGIVNTHHHYDHAGGNLEMLKILKSPVDIIAGSDTAEGVTVKPLHLDKLTLGNLEVTCIRTPCHTQDSICYHVKDSNTNEQCIFTGDTLFTAGCGRFFEGTGEQMNKALNETILEAVGRSNWALTRVYPGHEYTKSNVDFTRTIYKNPGDNKALDSLELFVKENEVTAGAFTIADELEFNPFMRLNDIAVRAAVGDKENQWPSSRVMDALRELKNKM